MSDAARKSFVVEPGRTVAGTLRVPGDKSVSHRALMLGSLADGPTTVSGFLAGEDCLATMRALRAMGADIETAEDGEVRIAGAGLRGLRAPEAPLDCGNSGTGMRLLAGLLSGQAFESELTGDASLRSRPMERVAGPLRTMGADIRTTEGKAPLRIRGGRLHGIDYTLPVASAQVKSAILLAGLYAEGRTTVRESSVTRDHTERMLRAFGTELEVGEGVVTLVPPDRLCATSIAVPGDLSSAAFALAAGCLSRSGPVVVENVGLNPTRTGILDILRAMGARIEVGVHDTDAFEPAATLTVSPSELRGIDVPPEWVPLAIDEFPLVFALAACAEGETVIRGAEELRHKESDRIAAMAAGLRALGVQVEERPDGARITGGGMRGGRIDSLGDHRIAMAFSVAAMCADGPVVIEDTANVATSFPGFVGRMQALGLTIREQEND